MSACFEELRQQMGKEMSSTRSSRGRGKSSLLVLRRLPVGFGCIRFQNLFLPKTMVGSSLGKFAEMLHAGNHVPQMRHTRRFGSRQSYPGPGVR